MQMKKFNNKIEIYLELSEITEMLKEWKNIQLKHPVNFYKHEKIENISWKLWIFKINNPNLKHIHDYHILFYIHHHNIFYDSHQAN